MSEEPITSAHLVRYHLHLEYKNHYIRM